MSARRAVASLVAGRVGLDRGDEEILCRVFHRDKLEHLGPIAGPLQKLRAQCVGDELGLTLLEDSVAERLRKGRGCGELRAQFLLAAG